MIRLTLTDGRDLALDPAGLVAEETGTGTKVTTGAGVVYYAQETVREVAQRVKEGGH